MQAGQLAASVQSDFYTKAGEDIAARRGGIQACREFFKTVLAELAEYD